MKTKTTPKSAFTLVEMLVVIAIISLVAMAVTRAVKGAQRTANATKCQANLKNLHAAVSTYLADKGSYPLASSYETMTRELINGKVEKVYKEHVGWVSWVPLASDKKRRGSSGKEKTEWEKTPTSSHAESYYYPPNVNDPKMRDAISEGSLFKYVGKDPASYKCPERRENFLSYAMNSWFFSHSWRHVRWHRQKKGYGADRGRNTHDDFRVNSNIKNTSKEKTIPSRMALFIEMEDDSSKQGREGQSGEGEQVSRIIKGDCAWEWWGEVGLEEGQFGHRKGKQKFCNVVFVDGHVAAIPDSPETPEEWNNHTSRQEVFKTLGEGSY